VVLHNIPALFDLCRGADRTTYPLIAELVFVPSSRPGRPYFQSTVFPLAIRCFVRMSPRSGAAVEARGTRRRCFSLWWAA